MPKFNWRIAAIAAVSVAALAAPAIAGHSWSSYHWKRTSAQITPPVVMALSGAWLDYDDRVVQDWNTSIYIESEMQSGSGVNPKTCKAQSGKILVCNAKYGFNGWLGLASIWLSGGHISQGTTKLNDSYFNTARYNTPAWRRMVFCQEVGHDYGLGHVNENFNDPNTGSCMDYTNDPSGTAGTNGTLSNEYPNKHDYDQLEFMYAEQHSSFTAVGPGRSGSNVGRAAPAPFADGGIPGDGPSEWGRAIHHDAQGRPDVFELDLGGGNKKITHVFWTLEARRGEHFE